MEKLYKVHKSKEKSTGKYRSHRCQSTVWYFFAILIGWLENIVTKIRARPRRKSRWVICIWRNALSTGPCSSSCWSLSKNGSFRADTGTLASEQPNRSQGCPPHRSSWSFSSAFWSQPASRCLIGVLSRNDDSAKICSGSWCSASDNKKDPSWPHLPRFSSRFFYFFQGSKERKKLDSQR